MAVDLMGHTAFAGEQVAFQEAAAAGLRSLELLASSLSPRAERPPPPLGEIADQAVSRFRRVINLLDRTGHARFRRAPVDAAPIAADSPPASPRPAPSSAISLPRQRPALTLDFTNPLPPAPKATAAPAAVSSTTSTSFLSSVTAGGGGGEGSVSKGQSLAAVSSGKPPLPTKRKKQQHPTASCTLAAPTTAGGHHHHHHDACHCSRAKRQRNKQATRTVRVPAPPSSSSSSSRCADIPGDDFSWRKYGQKPIKGSPFPRAYYRCSTVKGCPARKHVERDAAHPDTLIVTYEADHRHDVLKAT